MAMSINTNVMSLNTQRHLISTSTKMGVSMERLASGLRINSAKDDAAGLAVSQKMLGQIKSLDQAVRNANDGISMIQTAEGGMQETQTMLQRMRELATQGASSSISDAQRGYINTELQELKDEINKIADKTKFNGQSLLTGTLTTALGGATAADLVVGDTLTTGQTTMVTAIDVSGAESGTTFTMTESATTAGNVILTRSSDNVSQEITLSQLGANESKTFTWAELGVSITLQATSAGSGTAANLADDLDAAANDTIVTTGTGSAEIQVGADATDKLAISFTRVIVDGTVGGDFLGLHNALNTFNGATTRDNAAALLTEIDSATDKISSKRASLGAKQNRLLHTIANLQVISENTSASRGRIVDTDYASETASLTRSQILQQAGTAMLAQANASPQAVLALLQ